MRLPIPANSKQAGFRLTLPGRMLGGNFRVADHPVSLKSVSAKDFLVSNYCPVLDAGSQYRTIGKPRLAFKHSKHIAVA